MNKNPKPVLDGYLNKIWKSEKEFAKVYGFSIALVKYNLLHGRGSRFYMYLK